MRHYALLALAFAAAPCSAAVALDTLKLPPGFTIARYADDVPNARQLALGAKGTVFAGSREAGKVYALSDTDGDGRADRVRTIASGLRMPSGIAFRDGDLYIGAIDRVLVLRDVENHLDQPPKPEVVTDKLPGETHHGWKFLAFGPDGRLYVPIGAPCNICDKGKDYAKLLSMKPDGSDWRDEAFGIRNTVGFDWQPGTQQLWFTDNGRDLLGDELPADELNRVTRRGEHFGYPYCHQGDSLDPEFGAGKSCKDYTPPVVKLGAHVGAIGMRFYTGSMFPAGYRGAAIIAEHGSWNRSKKSGYRVVAIELDGAKVKGQQVLIDGFQSDEVAHGRPADVLVMPDGALLVSDDYAGAVYRVSYGAAGAKKEK
ncbi:PQQ-dependent sugar dehydrogenase [Dokdonella sp.]|uniref:PQQ-dependent sugar dehydrogenase n=1 Tax=Dokdonella sp. TaxID=2291710 RepID=UPI001B0C20ED|nr:PQQ-dependent sugar dehydrogenase [Dokdonella sp.]MBO9661392.1 sorbosone dehydrogenase family protein [Dokdonella sp.]